MEITTLLCGSSQFFVGMVMWNERFLVIRVWVRMCICGGRICILLGSLRIFLLHSNWFSSSIRILLSLAIWGNRTWWIPQAPETKIRDGYLVHPSSHHYPNTFKPIKFFYRRRAIDPQILFVNERYLVSRRRKNNVSSIWACE